MNDKYILGIDIGGTKTSVCAGNNKGDIFASSRMPTACGSPQQYLGTLGALCQAVMQKAGIQKQHISAVGISAPGPLDVKRGMLLTPPNLPALHGWQLSAAIGDMLGAKVFLNNDGNACALAEYMFGSQRGVSDLVYLTFSTGMGGGIISGGRLVQGASDCGGEVGHHVIDINGPACPCGQRGCWEVYVGGLMFARQVRQKIEQGAPSSMTQMVQGDLSRINVQTIASAVREKDPLAMEQWDQFIERLAQGVGNLIMILNPKVVILGTIAIHAGDLVLEPLARKLPKYTWPPPRQACQVVASSLGAAIGDLAALAVAAVEL